MSEGVAPATVLVMDANVLINLIHVGRLGLLPKLTGFRFVAPEEVVGEIIKPEHKAAMDAAIAAGILQPIRLDDPAELKVYGDLQSRLDKGESACIALAANRGWWIASDEKGRLRREVDQRLGPGKLLGTQDIYVRWIRAGALDVATADADKATLETKKFKMAFMSFRDILGTP